MSFAKATKAFELKAKRNIIQARNKTVLDLFRAVILDTARDTGRAAGNWQTSVGEIRNNAIERFGQEPAVNELVAVLGQWGVDDTVFIINNVAYIEELEKGSSKQSPNGMVAKNVERFRPILEAASRALR